jgi:Fur family ferric uptake transcriptional regulator
MHAERPQRHTRQRQVIVEELQKLRSHPTAATLYEIVRRRLPKISLGTVYRNLQLLARTGVIRKLEFAGAEARFDGNVARHDHLRCVRCGQVDDIHGPPLDLAGGDANDWGDYHVLGHRVEVFGICPQCRTEQADESGSGRSTSARQPASAMIPNRNDLVNPQ